MEDPWYNRIKIAVVVVFVCMTIYVVIQSFITSSK
jgi:hypothetical protein